MPSRHIAPPVLAQNGPYIWPPSPSSWYLSRSGSGCREGSVGDIIQDGNRCIGHKQSSTATAEASIATPAGVLRPQQFLLPADVHEYIIQWEALVVHFRSLEQQQAAVLGIGYSSGKVGSALWHAATKLPPGSIIATSSTGASENRQDTVQGGLCL